MAKELFEKATRAKLRFDTVKGVIATEDLWDFNLEQLNVIAKGLNQEVKTLEEEDFLEETKPENTKAALAFKVVLHILTVKKAERDDKIASAENKETKDKLLGALARKQDSALDNMTEKQLEKAIAAV